MTEADDLHKKDAEYITEGWIQGEGMEKQLIIVSIIGFLVCVGLSGCLGVGGIWCPPGLSLGGVFL